LIFISISYSPMKDANGKIIGVSGIARDISQRKKAEKEQQLLIKKLESTNKELESFAYVTSHDLKAPLRAIGSLADWLHADQAGKMDEQGREHLKLLKSRVSRMNELIDGILHYSRIGRIDGEKTPIDLNELVSDVLELLQVPENIDVEVQERLPVLFTHKTHITQIFENLVSNAVKYSNRPKGKIKIAVDELPYFWRFRVSDNGIGIEKKYQEKIFEIFQTLKPRDEEESTGIGLTIVKKIVETSGGEIWISSRPGKGSTFYFTLPKTKNE